MLHLRQRYCCAQDVRRIKQLLAVLLAAVLFTATAYAAQPTDTVEEIFSTLTADLRYGSRDRIMYCFAELHPEADTESYAASIRREAETLLGSERFVKPTDLQKCAIALAHCGGCTQELINAAVYFNDDFEKQGLNAYIWGVMAAGLAGLPPPDGALHTVESMTVYILSKQLPDGGFALTGSSADCDITAAVIYALKLSGGSNAAAMAAADRAFAALKAIQQPSGGFMGMGVENCESTAQAVIAAAVLGERTWIEQSGVLAALMSYRTEGGFCHVGGAKANLLATEQACSALTAYMVMEQGSSTQSGADEGSSSQSGADEGSSVQNGADEGNSTQSRLTGGQIRIIIVSVLAAGAVVLAVVWLCGGRKKPFAAVMAVLLALAAVGAALLNITTPEEYYAAGSSGSMSITVSALHGEAEIIRSCTVALPKNATAFDAIIEAARQQQVTVDYADSFSGAYIRGVGGLYEFDKGSESGWLYMINGESPSCSVSQYVLADGDTVTMVYTDHL